MIHQLLPSFFSGDAIGGQAIAVRTALRSMGLASSQVYAQHRDARLPDGGRDYRTLHLGRRDWLIYHHSIDSPVVEVAVRHVDRMVFYYHNVTPSRYLRDYDSRLASLLERGRSRLNRFRKAPRVFTDSDFDADELRELGFREPVIIPLLVDAESLGSSAAGAGGRAVHKRLVDAGTVNWLFVGRLAPNKRQDALIRAFHYYQRLIEPRSRLYLVGSDQFAPGYRLELQALVGELHLDDRVTLAGAPTLAEGFAGYYAGASVFVCASEHEGYCLPLVEAMVFGLPVVAYGCTGVPSAVGNAGLLTEGNDPAIIAEAVNLLLADPDLRARLAERQADRVAVHAPAEVGRALRVQLQDIATPR